MTEHAFDAYEEHSADSSLPLDHPFNGINQPTDAEQRTEAPRRMRQRKRDARPAQPASESREGRDEQAQLESQGFTADEAARLIHISDRLANSREAREAQAVIQRLRFHRWLVERGLLDEFSA